jgi:hypothetical protein
MSNPTLCDQQDAVQGKRSLLSLVHLITALAGGIFSKRRRRLTQADLSPELMRDIGLEQAPSHIRSHEENWRRELELLSR